MSVFRETSVDGRRFRAGALLAVAVVALGALGGCAGAGRSKRINLYRAPAAGYVREVDEPSARGTLNRISPEEMNVIGKFIISPDGEWVVYSARPADANRKEPYQLYKSSTRGSSSSVKLTAGGEHDAWYPSFTPDGKGIIYQAGGTFWKISLDGGGARTKIGGSGMDWDCCGDLSQQGRYVFTSNAHDVLVELFPHLATPIQLGSTGPKEKSSDKLLIWSVAGTGAELTQYREGENPRWSPDGKWIVFAYKGDIWMMSVDGGNLTQLTNSSKANEGMASFAYDGSRIVYASDEGESGKSLDNYNIWTMSLEGSQRTQLTELDAWDSWPVWNKDGIYFLSGRGSGNKNITRIWRLKTAK